MNLANGVENYPGYQFIEGDELISKFQQQINQFPINQKIGQTVTQINQIESGFEVVLEQGETFQGKALILASGKRPRKLNVAGEKELAGRGVTYCSIRDGPAFAGQTVAVIGGGNSAIEAALDLAVAVEQVDLVSLTPLTGDTILIKKLKQVINVKIYTEQPAARISGQEKVEAIEIKDIKTGNSQTLGVSGIFVEIGLMPNSEMVKGLVS